MTTHLVIGDSHSKHGVSNERYTWAGRLALELQADTVVDMGDWADMESLCSYDRGSKSFEGRRYKKDVAAALDARNKFAAPINTFNRARARNGKKQFRPRKVSLVGNHEHRISRAISLDPVLDGTISLDDLGYDTYGWKRVDYDGATPGVVSLDGILYSHYLTSGVLGRPIGGEHPAASILTKQFVSCTVGHSHVRDFSERTRADHRKILGMSAGCFTSNFEDYAGAANYLWWRGLIVKRNVKDGYYDPEFISMDELQRRYA